jgi:hypothetical protein
VADWVKYGSIQDLSGVLPVDPISALTITSQAGGNMLAPQGNANAMTAPGTEPVDTMQKHLNQVLEDPTITPSNAAEIEPADDGKPQASGQAGYHPAKAAWAPTTVPKTVRKAQKLCLPRTGRAREHRRPPSGTSSGRPSRCRTSG